jgi:hypothetical protein
MSIERNTAEDTCDKNRSLPPSSHESGSATIVAADGNNARSEVTGNQPLKNFQSQTNQHDNVSLQDPESTPLPPVEGDANLSFPDGGFQAWLVVFGSFCAQGAVFGLINTAAVFESYFKANQLKDYTSSEIGWIFSLYLFLVFFIGVQAGPVFDRHGARLLLAGGSICVVASLMLLSISKSKLLRRDSTPSCCSPPRQRTTR